MKNTLGYSAATLLMLFPLQGFTQDGGEASLKLSGGMAVAPIYQGASSYSAEPLYDIEAGYAKSAWGDFSLGLSEGARWQLPLSGPFGIALLAGYDAGRDEEVKTLSGRNKRLKGMGDLKGAFEAGIELSYKFDAFHAYVKGMQATKTRRYGGGRPGAYRLRRSGRGGGLSAERYADPVDRPEHHLGQQRLSARLFRRNAASGAANRFRRLSAGEWLQPGGTQ